jgi:hypothetical protein
MALPGFDSWAQWVVVGGVIAVVIGLMIAVSPNRPRVARQL